MSWEVIVANLGRHRRWCVTLSVTCFLFGLNPCVWAQSQNRPNVIMMMADDMGWGDVDFAVRLGENGNGNPVFYSGTNQWDTPNLADMASNGLAFSRMYSQSPVCSPTRASVMTGRAPERTGIPFANNGRLENREITAAEYAKSLGYTTGHFGKWHLGVFTRDFRDANRGGTAGSHNVYSTPLNSGFDVQYSTESKVSTYDPGTSGLTTDTRYWTGPNQFVPLNSPDLQGDDSAIIARETNSFMQQAVNDEQPFFAVSWFHTPHKPLNTPGNGNVDNLTAYRFAMEDMDAAIGQIRDQVQSLGVANDTIIMFTSDNGPEDGQEYTHEPLRANKRELYEGGVRVPGLIEWPGSITPGETHTPMVTTDYLPTLLDIWDVDTFDDRPMDGVSMTENLFGDRAAVREPSIIFKSTNGHQSALGVGGQYKLISTNNGSSWTLYDIVNDFDENAPLATSGNIGSATPELQATYQQLLDDYNARASSIANSISNGITGDYSTLVTNISDAVLQVEPPENLHASTVTDDFAQVFLERQFATVLEDLPVDSDGSAGTFSVSAAAVVSADSLVHSFLVHFNPDGQNGDGEFSITFDNRILGVIAESQHLLSSDYLSFADPEFEASGLRGLEATDNWTIHPDGRTISFSLNAIATLDQIRVLQAASMLIGDFDSDGDYDCADVDALVAEIAASTNDATFDLDSNGVVDDADLAVWLAEAGAANNPSGNPYLPGDANLDGSVDVGDFNIWNADKFTSTAAWCHGDFNADGVVDASDFNIWNANKFTSSDVATVPEPTSMVLIEIAFLGLFGIRRNRQCRLRISARS